MGDYAFYDLDPNLEFYGYIIADILDLSKEHTRGKRSRYQISPSYPNELELTPHLVTFENEVGGMMRMYVIQFEMTCIVSDPCAYRKREIIFCFHQTVAVLDAKMWFAAQVKKFEKIKAK